MGVIHSDEGLTLETSATVCIVSLTAAIILINPFSPEIKKSILLTYYWENV